jgi:hypothetical protein
MKERNIIARSKAFIGRPMKKNERKNWKKKYAKENWKLCMRCNYIIVQQKPACVLVFRASQDEFCWLITLHTHERVGGYIFYLFIYLFIEWMKIYLRLDAIIKLLQMGSYNFQSFSSYSQSQRLWCWWQLLHLWWWWAFARWVVVVSSLWQNVVDAIMIAFYAPGSCMNSRIDVGVV